MRPGALAMQIDLVLSEELRLSRSGQRPSVLRYPVPTPCRYFKTRPGIICPAMMLDVRRPLSLRNIEDLQHDRGIGIGREIASRRPPLPIINRLWVKKVRRQSRPL